MPKPKKTKAIRDAEARLKILIAESRSMRTSGVGRQRPAQQQAADDAASALAKRLRIMRREAGVQ